MISLWGTFYHQASTDRKSLSGIVDFSLGCYDLLKVVRYQFGPGPCHYLSPRYLRTCGT